MNLHMAAKISSIVEVLAAHSAGGSELAGAAVYGHVVLKVPQLRERLAALAASVPCRRRVPPHVHSEVLATRENLKKFYTSLKNLLI